MKATGVVTSSGHSTFKPRQVLAFGQNTSRQHGDQAHSTTQSAAWPLLADSDRWVDAEFSRELSSEGSQPHIVARLVERAETSEVQLAYAQQELKTLKQVATARAAAEGAGTSAAMSAAQVSCMQLQHQMHMGQCFRHLSSWCKHCKAHHEQL